MTSTTEFAPITLNGEPVVTWRDVSYIELDGRLYAQNYVASSECTCRRCLFHEDFGGCPVWDAMYGLIEFMINPAIEKEVWG